MKKVKEGKGNTNFRLRIIMSAILLAFLFLALVITKRIIAEKYPEVVSNPNMPENLQEVEVVWVSDADTIICKEPEKEEFTVRLIGFDAPESVHPDEEKNTEDFKTYLLNVL